MVEGRQSKRKLDFKYSLTDLRAYAMVDEYVPSPSYAHLGELALH